jgi:hypothetical protein
MSPAKYAKKREMKNFCFRAFRVFRGQLFREIPGSLIRPLTVQLLKFIPSKSTIEPHVRQLLLDAVGLEPLVQVFEIDEIEMLVLIEA